MSVGGRIPGPDEPASAWLMKGEASPQIGDISRMAWPRMVRAERRPALGPNPGVGWLLAALGPALLLLQTVAGSGVDLLRREGRARPGTACWGRDPATVSRWLAEWAEDGTMTRARRGNAIKAIAQTVEG